MTRQIESVELSGKEQVFSWFDYRIAIRNPAGDKLLICVMDGERALWKMLKIHKIKAFCVLDIYHVLERLWDAAHCFCQEGSEATKEFVTVRLKRILEGDVGRVIGGLTVPRQFWIYVRCFSMVTGRHFNSIELR